MSILRKILKGAEGEKTAKSSSRTAKRPANKKSVKDEQENAAIPVVVPAGAHHVSAPVFAALVHPHVTEKTAAASEQRKYAFVVSKYATKRMIKKAVEARFGVAVESVHTMHMPGKERRRGRQIGWRSGFKKALITLTEGQTIELQ